jgi:TrmH family RNA methyltransferase
MMQGMERPTAAQLKGWKRLTLAKNRREDGAFLAEGEKVVEELLKSGSPVKAILVCPEIVAWNQCVDGAPVFALSQKEWGGLSQDKSPEGVMAVVPWPPQSPLSADVLQDGAGPVLLLYQVNNPSNLGALIRTAHWFGFSAVVLSRNSCEAVNPKAVRASMGSIFHMRIIEDIDFEGLISGMADRFTVIGSDVRDGIAPHPCGSNTALLLGSESHGLPDQLLDLTDEKWKIPGAGGGESLSLPQAGAIMMYECARGSLP